VNAVGADDFHAALYALVVHLVSPWFSVFISSRYQAVARLTPSSSSSSSDLGGWIVRFSGRAP
jgi:hypothetical protein